MPKIPGISAEQAVRIFEKLGYRIIRQGKHIVMSDGFTRLTIPRHNPIHAYTMGAIARDADLSPQEFRIPVQRAQECAGLKKSGHADSLWSYFNNLQERKQKEDILTVAANRPPPYQVIHPYRLPVSAICTPTTAKNLSISSCVL